MGRHHPVPELPVSVGGPTRRLTIGQTSGGIKDPSRVALEGPRHWLALLMFGISPGVVRVPVATAVIATAVVATVVVVFAAVTIT